MDTTTKTYHLTTHARTRCQQRGITPDAITLIMRYGEERPIPHGAYAYFMTSRARRKILDSPDRDTYLPIADRMDGYVIADTGGNILTVARPEPGRFRRRDDKRPSRKRRLEMKLQRHPPV